MHEYILYEYKILRTCEDIQTLDALVLGITRGFGSNRASLSVASGVSWYEERRCTRQLDEGSTVFVLSCRKGCTYLIQRIHTSLAVEIERIRVVQSGWRFGVIHGNIDRIHVGHVTLLNVAFVMEKAVNEHGHHRRGQANKAKKTTQRLKWSSHMVGHAEKRKTWKKEGKRRGTELYYGPRMK